jgi:hypothetical protein
VKEGADGRAVIEPITRVEHIWFKDIVSYDDQKQQLKENTEAFLQGIPANNVLLFGDAGTGKSSCVVGMSPIRRSARILRSFTRSLSRGCAGSIAAIALPEQRTVRKAMILKGDGSIATAIRPCRKPSL